MRRPQRSELIKSDICQSGPDSSSTTFLPAFDKTEANSDPDAPAPTITTSTFSCGAISPPFRRFDVRHVRNAKCCVAIHCAVDHVDRIAAQHQIDEWSGRTLPA